MKALVHWIQAFAVGSGGIGLFALTFLDSSFLSFPMVSDLLVISMVTQHRERLLYYALAPALGSTAGCLVLYFIARAGGEAFLRKRFKERHVENGLRTIRKHGVLAVVIPALLPPPAPFKIFILLAGVAEIQVAQFSAAVFGARFLRFFAEALLAFFYGEAAGNWVKSHAMGAGLIVSGLALASGLGWIWWSRRKRL
jgi:membrane protein YqaA with SNARE-associated domain